MFKAIIRINGKETAVQKTRSFLLKLSRLGATVLVTVRNEQLNLDDADDYLFSRTTGRR